MRISGLLVLFLLPQAHANPILILGDSLSAGYGMEQEKSWVYLLQQQTPDITIINGSVSGETSAGGLRRLPALLESTQAKLVFIELGGNDGLRGFAPKQLKNNLTKMIQLAKASGAKVLLSEVMVPPNYGPRYAKQFTQVYEELASEHGITLVPFFMTQIAIHPELMQADGIHPNEQAQPQIADFLHPWLINTQTDSQ
ncbi:MULTISPECIES: arylesterase [Shewanella]|uniref:Arylesterase n=1 Tax=Shewanella marisflavi TaxID=260364 RepID=A0AAC9U4M6_9GAMM|nr:MULTISPECIES: arylesterase [Shewanella]ASJ98607.1 arylesterase [Shewanella marisflavi]MCL1043440.1 arylesterase [Shewanella marisflavi]QDF77202.1 arylesterase [Shewanella marisflavi]